MSLWTLLSDIVSRLPGADAVGTAIDRALSLVRIATGTGEDGRQVAFTVAMIALTAKIAKADGVVTADEVSVVRRLIDVPDDERGNVARLFDLAQQDVAGFDAYARKIRVLHASDPDLLEDIIDGLFTIAQADGLVHEREDDFIGTVAAIFEVPQDRYAQIRARHLEPDETDPYAVLGLPRGSSAAAVKAAWRRLVTENHPDRLIAHGLPPEAVKLASDRTAALNAAYEAIERELVP